MRIDRIIVSRIDNIGDVVLALPTVGIIKERFPSCSVHFLGRSYTRAVIECCEHVDGFLNWEDVAENSPEAQAAFLREQNADVIIHVFPRRKIAVAARKAAIPVRIGTARKGYHVLNCNRRPYFSRRKSDLHEAQLNVKLLRPFGIKTVPSLSQLPAYYGLTSIPPLRQDLAALLAHDKVNLILHPRTKGHAGEWGLHNFARLASILPQKRFRIFVTGTVEEETAIADRLPFGRPNVTSMIGRLRLDDLISFVSRADALIAASTGPLHLAAALGREAIGLYSPKRHRHPGRWAPVGEHARALLSEENCERCREGIDCACIEDIPPSTVYEILKPLADRLS